MIAFFRYAPIDILTVFLPPAMLEYRSKVQQEWIRKEATDVRDTNAYAIDPGFIVTDPLGC